MKNKLFTKTVALFLAVVSVVTFIQPVKAAQIINPNPLVDIVINPCSDYNVSYAQFSQDLAEALKAKGMDMSTVRLTQAGIQLNTLDLTEWYVYDHYDNGIIPSNTFETYSGRRPYFANTGYAGTSQMTINNWFSSGTCNNSSNVCTLNQHILSSVDTYGKASMMFAGYGDAAYNDFLFYPASTRYKKSISFDIDAANVKTHSMNGSGFLVNAGVDLQGNLQGYLLYFEYTPAGSSNADATGAKVTLYRLKGDQTPAQIHSNVGINGINKTQVGSTKTLTLNSTTKKTKVYVEISTDFISVQEQPYTDSNGTQGTLNTIMNNVGINTATFPYTNYNGFGPFVSYSSHSCSATSFFIFSDLVMSFQTDAFEAVRNSQFAQDKADTTVKRFFINLAKNNAEIPEVAAEFNEGVLRLANDKIKYISTVEDSTTVSGEDTSVKDIIGENNTYYTNSINYETYVDEIADYIVNHGEWSTTGINAPTLVAPAASFTIVGKEAGAPDSDYVQTLSIHKKHLSDQNSAITITFDDNSYPVDESRPITKWDYTIRNSNGVIVSQKAILVTDADKTPPSINITSDSPEGNYTLSLMVTDSTGVTSTSSTLCFSVINDAVAPEIFAASSSTFGKVDLTFTDGLSGVQKYQIGSSDPVTFVTARAQADITVDVPQDGTPLVVQVWDECGNLKAKTFNTNKITYIKGLDNGTDVYIEAYVINGGKIGAFPPAPTDESEEPKGFTGWFTAYGGTSSVTVNQVINADVTYYGGWNSSFADVTLDANGGTLTVLSPIHVAIGTPYISVATLAGTPTKAGYDFTGWTLSNGSALGAGTVQESGATFRANWKYGNVTLTLDPNCGVPGKFSELVDLNGTSVTSVLSSYGAGKTNPSRAGFTFVKWTTEKDNASTAVTSSDKLGDNGKTIYAYWQRDYMLFETAALPNATYGSEYSTKVSATNGTGKYTYELAEGSTLPEGLTLDTATGVISGTISATPSATAYSFNIIAHETVTADMTETTPISRPFSIKVSAGPAPVLTAQSINVKADATDIEDAIKSTYSQLIGVEDVTITASPDGTVDGDYAMTVTFSNNYLSNKVQTGLVVTVTTVNPKVEFVTAEIPSIRSDDRKNANETALLEYLNSYDLLQMTADDNTIYNLAKGTAPTQRVLDYTFADENSSTPKTFKPNEAVTYTFEATYFGNDLSRTLQVKKVDDTPLLAVSSTTIRKFVGDKDFNPSPAVTSNGIQISADVTYSISSGSAVVSTNGTDLHIIGAGTASVLATASANGYATGYAYLTIIVSDKPVITPDSNVKTNPEDNSATLTATLKLGTEPIISAGFKYRKLGGDYIDVPAIIKANGEVVADITKLDSECEYEYYAYCKTQTGIVNSDTKLFSFDKSKLVITGETTSITDVSAVLKGTVLAEKVDEKGFEYKSLNDATFVRIPVASEAMEAEIKGLLAETDYQFRAYAVINGKTVYGKTVDFKTEKTADEVSIVATGYSDVYYPTSKNPYVFDITAPKDSTGLVINGFPKATVSAIDVNSKKNIDTAISDGDAKSQITLNSDGTIAIGSNVQSAVITVTLSDGTSIKINYVKGDLNVNVINDSQLAVSNASEEMLRASIGSEDLLKLIENGSKVNVNLIVSDLGKTDSVIDEFNEFVENNIGTDASMLYLDIQIQRIVDGNLNDISYITKLNHKIYIELEVKEEFLENAHDLRVLHKKHDGTIEVINVIRNGNKVGFYADEFSPYILVYVNKFSVDVNISGSGKVTTDNGSFDWFNGENAIINITPDDGYVIKSIKDNGVEIPVTDTYTINAIDKNHTIDVEFAAANGGTVATNPDTGEKTSPVRIILVIALCCAGIAFYKKKEITEEKN